MIHIGTSATMVADRSASPQQRRAAVADFAARLFGHPLTADDVVEEELVPFTEAGTPTQAELAAAITAPLPATAEAFRRHALARWAEAEFGIEPEADARWKRRVPRSMPDAAAALAAASGADAAVCEAKLRDFLACAGELHRPEGGRAFAYKLHQFIGQGRDLYATLEPADTREFSLDGQLKASGGRLSVPIKFCRQCGQDYYHVLRADDGIQPHPAINQSENTRSEESDFYPYRYLASEGFLPGYNFPALPVRAWVPRFARGEYISRPRFLALREFAPGIMTYHEGARWEVWSFQSPPGGLDDRRTSRRLCRTCGAFCEHSDDLCPVCNTRFDGQNSLIASTLEMPKIVSHDVV